MYSLETHLYMTISLVDSSVIPSHREGGKNQTVQTGNEEPRGTAG
jgi:hypothetical protein